MLKFFHTLLMVGSVGLVLSIISCSGGDKGGDSIPSGTLEPKEAFLTYVYPVLRSQACVNCHADSANNFAS